MKPNLPVALIVDDDIDWVEILAASVETLGYETCAVPDPPQARAWLGGHRPDMIILDLLMPNGNGVDLCRWIRAQKGLERVPVVIISGLKDQETVARALELGSVEFIHKPFKFETLRFKAERLLHPATTAPRSAFHRGRPLP